MALAWRVVGGADRGGILVREGCQLNSVQSKDRLAFGAIVKELELSGERLHYELVSGAGPRSGWVSMKLKGKVLLEPEDVAGSSRVHLEVRPSAKNGTLRHVEHSIEELEKRAELNAKLAQTDGRMEESLRETVDDLLYLARDRAARKRILLSLGALLQIAVKEKWTVASNIVCWKLCMVSWASSLQDVVYCVGGAQSPIVVLFGFGGSHVDELQPLIDRWSAAYGAAVIAGGPTLLGKIDQLEAIYNKLMELFAEGARPLILHFCSDGGFASARDFLKLWADHARNKAHGLLPQDVLRCVVSDSAGLGQGHHGIIKDGTYMPGHEEFAKDPAKLEQALNAGLLGFFTGCAFNMFMQLGACKAFYEEPANSFGKALSMCVNSRVLINDALAITNTLWAESQEFFLGVPILVISSKGDRVVTLDRSLFMKDVLEAMPGRQTALASRWRDAGEEVLADDGLGVHVFVFDKTLHCKGFLSDPESYWGAVDRLVQPCLA